MWNGCSRPGPFRSLSRRAGWRWARHRAAVAVHRADLEVCRSAVPANLGRLERAAAALRRLELNRP